MYRKVKNNADTRLEDHRQKIQESHQLVAHSIAFPYMPFRGRVAASIQLAPVTVQERAWLLVPQFP